MHYTDSQGDGAVVEAPVIDVDEILANDSLVAALSKIEEANGLYLRARLYDPILAGQRKQELIDACEEVKAVVNQRKVELNHMIDRINSVQRSA